MERSSSQTDPGLAKLLSWSLRYALRRGRLLALLSGCSLVQVALEVLKPWPVVILIDFVLRGQAMPPWLNQLFELLPGDLSPDNLIAWCVILTVAIFAATWAFGLGYVYAKVSLGQRMVYDLAEDVLARLQQLSLRFHTHSSVGDTMHRITADATCLSTILIEALLPVVSALVSLAAMMFILWRTDAGLTLMALAVVPFMALGLKRYAGPMLEKSYAQQACEARLYEELEQTFSAMPMIAAFGREPRQDRRFHNATRDTLDSTLALTRVQLQFKIWMGLATAVGTGLILWQGTQHALSGSLTVGAIILFLSYLGSLYAPLEAITYTSSTLQGAAGSARRVMEIFSQKTEVQDRPGAGVMRRGRGAIRFEAVSFAYEPGHPVLQEITLDVPGGEMVALVGPTGVGKSTLASLVPRFYDPSSGRVLVEGQDIRDLQLRSLRQHISLVLQEPFLFPFSVAENIAYGRPAASREEIEAAARAAHAHDFIMAMPRGYDTVVGGRGATLSGGERQRIAIARALLRDAPILILDEPTSSLDVATEHEVMLALRRLVQHRTTLLIAHRLSTVRWAHRIAVLDQGRIVQRGTHDTLLAAGGLYGRWCELQSSRPTSPPPPTAS